MRAPGSANVAGLIEELRQELVCERCRRYVGTLDVGRRLPPPYPVALAPLGPDRQIEVMLGFERYMLQRARQGNFRLRHPERDGRCVSLAEWAAKEDDDSEV